MINRLCLSFNYLFGRQVSFGERLIDVQNAFVHLFHRIIGGDHGKRVGVSLGFDHRSTRHIASVRHPNAD